MNMTTLTSRHIHILEKVTQDRWGTKYKSVCGRNFNPGRHLIFTEDEVNCSHCVRLTEARNASKLEKKEPRDENTDSQAIPHAQDHR